MVKSKCNSDCCRLLDFIFPCKLTTLTTSKNKKVKSSPGLARELLTIIGN